MKNVQMQFVIVLLVKSKHLTNLSKCDILVSVQYSSLTIKSNISLLVRDSTTPYRPICRWFIGVPYQ